MPFTPAESAAFAAVEAVRAMITTNTSTGGWAVPLALDPGLATLTNAGAANPFREACTVTTTISSPARKLTTAGVDFAWVAEGAAYADNSNTWTKVDIPLYKLGGFVSASFEVLGDAGATLMGTLPALLRDSRDRAEASVFAVGDGTTQPKGIVTAISASSGFVTATTRGSFTSASSQDIFSLWEALPARAHQSSKVAWMGHVKVLDVIRTMGATAPAGLFTVDLSAAQIPRILGAPVYEVSAMSSATTSGTSMLVAAALDTYNIVDHIEGGVLDYVPILFDQATGRPNGSRGWVYHQRTGADLLDTGQGRILKA